MSVALPCIGNIYPHTIPDTGSVRQSAQKISGNRGKKEGKRGRGEYE